MRLKVCNRLECRWHICAFADRLHAIFHKQLRRIKIDLILRCARQSNIARNRPDAAAPLMIFCIWMRRDVFLNAGTAHFLDVLERREVNAVRVVNIAARIRASDYFRAVFLCLFNRIGCNVSGAGDNDRLVFQINALCIEHILHEVEKAVPGRLRTRQAPPEIDTFSGQNARIIGIPNTLVLTEEVADLTTANANITCGDIDIQSDVAVEFRHKALAELHHLVVRLAVRIEVRAAFAAADGKSRQRIFEHLLKREEFQNIKRYARMKAQSALIGAHRARHLHTIAAVDLNLALIVHPRHAERYDALRLDHTLEDLMRLVLRMLFEERHNRGQNLFHRVLEMRLIRVTFGYEIENIIDILLHVGHDKSPFSCGSIDSATNVTEYSTGRKACIEIHCMNTICK